MPTPSLRTLAEYEAQALARLPTQFRGKPRLQAMLLAMAGQHQDAEAGFFSLWAQRLLATATGAALTQLGAVVGQERGGLTDESFRLRIYARLLINRSSGTIPELLAIFALITPLAAELLEYPPAAFELRLDGGALSLPDDFAAILRAARAAGVGAGLLYQTEEDADTFTFFGGSGAGFPASHPGHISQPTTVVTTGSPADPFLFQDPPPEATGPYLVTVELTFVDTGTGTVNFDYTLNSGETPRAGTVLWTPGEFFPLATDALDSAGIAVSFTQDEPYAIGDTWTWTVGALAGGSLTGILSA